MDRPQCSDVEKGKIIALRENGLSIGEISATLQKSKSTINRWIRRYEMKGQVGKRRRPGGLTKKTTEVQDEEFLAIARNNPLWSSAKILHATDIPVSTKPVRRRLKQAGLTCYKAAKVIQFTEQHAQMRREFALQNLNENWESTVFADEKRSGRISSAFWGWMSLHGPGDLVGIDGRLTANGYINILEEYIGTTTCLR
ncbi:Transposase [Popillia japonica]|uniref:Transposase n=1 Tax=Popillia japonica TaxID=7064 RepID=A0AAW1MJF5_POPJA